MVDKRPHVVIDIAIREGCLGNAFGVQMINHRSWISEKNWRVGADNQLTARFHSTMHPQ